MKLLNFCGIALLCGLIALVGCAEPEAVSSGGGGSAGVSTAGGGSSFEVVKPSSYSGDFNPSGLEVGPEVGMLAPEIEGPDLDGIQFKLSDYRGKVVMLDFYGDW